MRAALPCVFLTVLISPWSVAQQVLPPAAQPTEARPAEPKPKPAEGEAAPRTTPNVDPARLSPPKAADAKKPGGPMDDNSYILGAEDNISVMVNNSVEFNGNHLIRPDGRITINLVGEVMAAGLTPEELTEVLKEKIKKYVVDPDVTISVLGVNSKHRNGDVGVYHVFLNFLLKDFGQLLRSEAGRHHFSHEIDGDAAIRTDQVVAVKLHAVVDHDADIVFGAEDVAVVVHGAAGLLGVRGFRRRQARRVDVGSGARRGFAFGRFGLR